MSIGDRRSARREQPLTAAQQELVRSASHLVDKIARVLVRRGGALDVDELASLGRAGLVEAAQTFDPSFGVNFEGFAWPRVHGAMKNGAKRERAEHRARMTAAIAASYAYAEAQADEGDPMTDTERDIHARIDASCDGFVAAMALGYFTAAARVDGDEAAAERDAHARAVAVLKEARESLPERDRRLVEMHYEEQLDLKEVAVKLGCSYISARRYHHAAVQRLGARVRGRGLTAAPGG